MNPAVAYELVELEGYTRVMDAADTLDNWEGQGHSLTTDNAHSGTSSILLSAPVGGDYFFESVNPIIVGAGDEIRFWIDYDTRDSMGRDHLAYGYVEVSTNGRDFESIPGNITTTDNPNGNNRGHGITGTSNGWVEAIFDLSSYVGQDVWIRFSYTAIWIFTGEGMYIDDIYPVDAFASETVISSTLTETDYTFGATTPSTYYYRVRAEDAEGQWSAFSDTRSTLVYDSGCCVGLRGNVNNDPADQIDISDLVALIEIVYHDGAPPECPPEANVDGSADGSVDVDDVTYLVDYMFRGGPAPADCQ